MPAFGWIIAAALVGVVGYEIFKTSPKPALGTGGGPDTIEDLPESATSGLTIDQLIELALSKPDIVAMLAEEGTTAPEVRSKAKMAWESNDVPELADISVESYAIARNVAPGVGGASLSYVRRTKPALSPDSVSIMIDVSNRYGDKAVAIAAVESADEHVKTMALLKEHRRAADEAAFKGSSVVGPAGLVVLTPTGTGAVGGGGGGGVKPWEPAVAELMSSSDVQAVFSASDLATSKQQISDTWDHGTTKERTDMSNMFYATARGIDLNPDGSPSVPATRPAWSPRTVDDYNELSDLFGGWAEEQDPANAGNTATIIGFSRAAIDAADAASKISGGGGFMPAPISAFGPGGSGASAFGI